MSRSDLAQGTALFLRRGPQFMSHEVTWSGTKRIGLSCEYPRWLRPQGTLGRSIWARAGRAPFSNSREVREQFSNIVKIESRTSGSFENSSRTSGRSSREHPEHLEHVLDGLPPVAGRRRNVPPSSKTVFHFRLRHRLRCSSIEYRRYRSRRSERTFLSGGGCNRPLLPFLFVSFIVLFVPR
jgi:hypothetical protein